MSGLAAEIAQLPGEEIDGALEAMDRSGLVRAAPDGSTEFVHPLFAQALYGDLGDPLRARLPARAFTALVGRGREAEAAEHAVRAELLGDPIAVGVLHRVGLAARRAGAVTSATDRLQAAIELAGDAAQPDLLLTAGQALLEAGRPETALAAHERLLAPDGADPRIVLARCSGPYVPGRHWWLVWHATSEVRTAAPRPRAGRSWSLRPRRSGGLRRAMIEARSGSSQQRAVSVLVVRPAAPRAVRPVQTNIGE